MIEFVDEGQLLPKASSAVIPWDFTELNQNNRELYLGLTQEFIGNYRPLSPEEIEIKDWPTESHKYQLVENESLSSDAPVIYITINDAFYLAVHEILPFVDKIHTSDPSIHFILHRPPLHYPKGEKEQRDAIYRDIIKFFSENKVNFSYLGPDDPPTAYKVKNFLDMSKNLEPFENNDLYLTHQDVKNTINKLKKFYGANNAESPQRKVYLSRTHLAEGRKNSELDLVPGSKNQFKNDIRMEDEYVLEDFFRSKGYDILIPEQRFSTLKEQVEYFEGVKILAGVTGSGLVNCLLMQDSQLVVEVVAELVFDEGHEGASFQVLNSEFYLHDSYIKEHTYLAIPSRRDPYRVIESLEGLDKKVSL